MIEKDIINWDGWRVVWLCKENWDATQELLEKGQIDGVALSPYKNFKPKDLVLVLDLPNLKGVAIPVSQDFDLSVLAKVKSFEFLAIGGVDAAFDFRILDRLVYLNIGWNKNIILPKEDVGIRQLCISDYKPRRKNLYDLPVYQTLEHLAITQSALKSLDGIERFQKLSCLELNYMRSLTTIKGLGKTNVKEVLFESCKKIEDWEQLGAVNTLQKLSIVSCGAIPTLSFREQLPYLKKIRCFKTDILDE